MKVVDDANALDAFERNIKRAISQLGETEFLCEFTPTGEKRSFIQGGEEFVVTLFRHPDGVYDITITGEDERFIVIPSALHKDDHELRYWLEPFLK